MKSVIIDICKYLLFALIALGLVAALVGCGDDSENSVPPFSFKPFSPIGTKLPDVSQLSALIRVSDNRFPMITNYAYNTIPASTYLASPNSYDIVCFVWNSPKAATLQLMEIFVDLEGYEYHVQDPGYGRKPQFLSGAYAELVQDYPRGVVPAFIVRIGSDTSARLVLTTDTFVAERYDGFAAFFCFHPSLRP